MDKPNGLVKWTQQIDHIWPKNVKTTQHFALKPPNIHKFIVFVNFWANAGLKTTKHFLKSMQYLLFFHFAGCHKRRVKNRKITKDSPIKHSLFPETGMSTDLQ